MALRCALPTVQCQINSAVVANCCNHPFPLRNRNGAHIRISRGGLLNQLAIESKEEIIQWRHHQVVASASAKNVAPISHTRPSRILISTGDVMGDMHGAALVRALMEVAAEAQVEVEICGVGGERMWDAGAHLIGESLD